MKKLIFALTALLVLPIQSLACSIGSDGKEHHAGKEVVQYADLILHVVADDYVKKPEFDPRKDNYFSTGPADSTIRFRVVEVIKGRYDSKEIIIQGFLGNNDDWNDVPVPYDFIRPGGRHGSCDANTYKDQGHFLLMLIPVLQLRGENLAEFFKWQYKPFPSLSERGKLYEGAGLGSGYTGTASQNTHLLAALTVNIKQDLEAQKKPIWSPYWYPLGPVNEQIKPEGDPWLAWVKDNVK